MSRPFILLTNDDGYDAPGLAALVELASAIGELLVVAPDREQSGSSHSLTLERPLRATQVADGRYRVDGTPTDCVHLAVDTLAGGRRPDLVLSGINRGLNVGDDVTYSGTVAGALEGTLLHIPSVAFSTELDRNGTADFAAGAPFARKVIGELLERGLPEGVFLNVNFPAAAAREVRITRQGTRRYRATSVERLDPSGRPYFWIAGADTEPRGEPDGDHAAIRDGCVSVSPMHINLTHEASIAELGDWELEGG